MMTSAGGSNRMMTSTGKSSSDGSDKENNNAVAAVVDEGNFLNFPIKVLDTMTSGASDWENRKALQSKWTNEEKGWQVPVEWKDTPYGIGLFAAADIPANTVLRIGTNGNNLMQFTSVEEIESFCHQHGNGTKGGGAAATNTDSTSKKEEDEELYKARLNYVSDYLWGFTPHNTNAQGYDLSSSNNGDDDDNRFFGMWIPGNGLNHHPNPNTVYRARQGGTDKGIVLVSLCDVKAGQELLDDYRRHGSAPKWLQEFAKTKEISLNFADCNDFVDAD